MNFPAGRTATQVFVIELDQVQGIKEHAAVVAMVDAGHAVALASRDTEGGVCVSTVSIVRTSVVLFSDLRKDGLIASRPITAGSTDGADGTCSA